MRPLRAVLIANRGEIAVRVVRACREMGLRSIAVYSDADAGAPHTRLADSAVRIGPPAPAVSYLSIEALMAAAHASDADAIHPGYGFLSENELFARACESAGLIWIGPPAAVIEQMGSKIAARQLMESAGVPVVPGTTPRDQSDEGIFAAVREIGYPVLVKASEGGGGKGMRALRDERTALEMIASARREALGAFGDGTLYVERLIERPRHVEIQVFGDAHGNVVHLFERECSLQRRHQKIVEESPSPALTPALRARMGDAAAAASRAAGYRNAGTIEFLVEGEGDGARFYFLEMNTRLQVEHPVTEAVTGVDLVRAQLTVAAGGRLPWTQESLGLRGHAIECRVYAEDPANGFLPQAGPLTTYREPSGPGIRIDSGVAEGGRIGVHYDPMLAKLVAFGETREAAVERAVLALSSYRIAGIRTNIPFLMRLLRHDAVAAGRLHTQFVDEHLDELTGGSGGSEGSGGSRGSPEPAGPSEPTEPKEPPEPEEPKKPADPARFRDPWTALRDWRLGMHHQQARPAAAPRPQPRAHRAAHHGSLTAPMPATVVRIQAEIGSHVKRGETLIVLEAMKMELPVRAPSDGSVTAINCVEGDLVQPGVTLIEIG
jgi:acetyl-CoA/propionyl-CoA carboxylase, biotin carboxylase, biotin carboxyl carrier protein